MLGAIGRGGSWTGVNGISVPFFLIYVSLALNIYIPFSPWVFGSLFLHMDILYGVVWSFWMHLPVGECHVDHVDKVFGRENGKL